MSYFAEKLKKIRTSAGLSMDMLAKAANVSKSMICKIERDEVQPTIDTAARLSKALGKTLSEMLHEAQTTQVVHLQREDQATWADAENIKRRNISPVFEGLKVEWLEVTLPAKMNIAKNMVPGQYGAEKFILMIRGVMDILIEDKTYHLKKGDSLYFKADVTHTFSNPGKEACEFYIVIKHPD